MEKEREFAFRCQNPKCRKIWILKEHEADEIIEKGFFECECGEKISKGEIASQGFLENVLDS